MKPILTLLIALPCFGAITVTWVSPTPGSTVTNPVQLSVTASSDAGPIQRVEYYRDGVLVATVYALLPPKIRALKPL